MALEISQITLPLVTTVSELMNWEEQFALLGANRRRRQWAFRGQPREYQTLAPSFQRLFATASHPAAELIERDLIAAFRQHYAVLPDRSADMPDPTAIQDGFDLRCLSVMQHYEVPTRLLDWTGDFWTAIYFACASEPDANAEVWVYDRAMFAFQLQPGAEFSSLLASGPNSPKEPQLLGRRNDRLLVELDPRLTPRMRQQHGHHTVSANVFQDHAQLLDELQATLPPLNEEPWHFRRMTIDKSCKSKALRFLADHRKITASTIFPDVVGLGRFLRWHLDSLRTMLQ
jgi:FRG domain